MHRPLRQRPANALNSTRNNNLGIFGMNRRAGRIVPRYLNGGNRNRILVTRSGIIDGRLARFNRRGDVRPRSVTGTRITTLPHARHRHPLRNELRDRRRRPSFRSMNMVAPLEGLLNERHEYARPFDGNSIFRNRRTRRFRPVPADRWCLQSWSVLLGALHIIIGIYSLGFTAKQLMHNSTYFPQNKTREYIEFDIVRQNVLKISLGVHQCALGLFLIIGLMNKSAEQLLIWILWFFTIHVYGSICSVEFTVPTRSDIIWEIVQLIAEVSFVFTMKDEFLPIEDNPPPYPANNQPNPANTPPIIADNNETYETVALQNIISESPASSSQTHSNLNYHRNELIVHSDDESSTNLSMDEESHRRGINSLSSPLSYVNSAYNGSPFDHGVGTSRNPFYNSQSPAITTRTQRRANPTRRMGSDIPNSDSELFDLVRRVEEARERPANYTLNRAVESLARRGRREREPQDCIIA